MSQDIKPAFPRAALPLRPLFADPIASWMKMLLFGAAVGAMGSFFSALWGLAQLLARLQGVPTRRTMNLVYPYATLGVAAFSWMAVWALTSLSPRLDDRFRNTFSYWRSIALRLLVTASFLFLALRLSGINGEGLRPSFAGARSSLLLELCDAAVIILLWSHLRWIAVGQGSSRLAGRSVFVQIGQAGTLIVLFLIPSLFNMAHHPLRLPWPFLNFRACAAVFWDVMAAMVLTKFVLSFLAEPVRWGR